MTRRGGVMMVVPYKNRFRQLRAFVALRLARLCCLIEGTHFWTAPVRPPELGGRKVRLCARCGRIGKPFQFT